MCGTWPSSCGAWHYMHECIWFSTSSIDTASSSIAVEVTHLLLSWHLTNPVSHFSIGRQ